jgi:hypothetical protein
MRWACPRKRLGCTGAEHRGCSYDRTAVVVISCFVALRVVQLPGSDCGDPGTRKVSGNSPLFSHRLKSTSNNSTMLSIFELFAIIEDDLDGGSRVINVSTFDSKTETLFSWVLSNPSNGLIRFLVLWFGL